MYLRLYAFCKLRIIVPAAAAGARARGPVAAARPPRRPGEKDRAWECVRLMIAVHQHRQWFEIDILLVGTNLPHDMLAPRTPSVAGKEFATYVFQVLLNI